MEVAIVLVAEATVAVMSGAGKAAVTQSAADGCGFLGCSSGSWAPITETSLAHTLGLCLMILLS